MFLGRIARLAKGGRATHKQRRPLYTSLHLEPLDNRINPAPGGSLNQAFISQVYLDLFHRPVDPSGLATWGGFVDQTGNRSGAIYGIQNATSQEFRVNEVQQLYLQLLGRAVDPVGLANSVPFLARGGTYQGLAAIIAGSPEYYQTKGGGTNNGFLSALYQDLLGRPIDPVGEALCTQALAAGYSRQQIADALCFSPEYDHQLVNQLFQQFLHHPAAPLGQDLFTNLMGQGTTYEQVIITILASPEYFSQLSATQTAISSSANPSVFGQQLTFTATVSAVSPGAGTPTGTVTFVDQTTNTTLGSPALDGNGQATVQTSALSVASHVITATYNPNGFLASSSNSLTQVVNQSQTTTSVSADNNPSVFGQAVTFSATITPVSPGAGTVGGTADLVIDNNTVQSGVTVTNGQVTFTPVSDLDTAGSPHTVEVDYNGDTNFQGSNGTLTGGQVVNP